MSDMSDLEGLESEKDHEVPDSQNTTFQSGKKNLEGGCWDIPAFIVGCYGFYYFEIWQTWGTTPSATLRCPSTERQSWGKSTKGEYQVIARRLYGNKGGYDAVGATTSARIEEDEEQPSSSRSILNQFLKSCKPVIKTVTTTGFWMERFNQLVKDDIIHVLLLTINY